jgi:hypothetical protein
VNPPQPPTTTTPQTIASHYPLLSPSILEIYLSRVKFASPCVASFSGLKSQELSHTKQVEETITDNEVPSSEYRPSPRTNTQIIQSPIQFRSQKRKSEVATCDSVILSFSSNDNNLPDTLSRPSELSNSSRSRLSTKPTVKASKRSRRKET